MNNNDRSLVITVNGFLTDRSLGFGGASTRFIRDSIDANLNE